MQSFVAGRCHTNLRDVWTNCGSDARRPEDCHRCRLARRFSTRFRRKNPVQSPPCKNTEVSGVQRDGR